MRTEIKALVVRDSRNNQIRDIFPIEDMYTTVCVTYYKDLVAPDQLQSAIDEFLGEDSKGGRLAKLNMTTKGWHKESQEAKDHFSVGFQSVGIETKMVEWE